MYRVPGPVSPRRAALAACLLLLPAAAAAQTDVERRVAAAPDGVVRVTNVAGSVVVRGWDRREVEVTGTLGRGVDRLEVDSSAGNTDVEVVLPRRSYGGGGDAHLEVRVPAGSRVELELVSAAATVSDVTGDVRVETVSGSIAVRGDARTVEAESVSGSVDVRTRSRAVDAETVSGSVRIDGVRGDVDGSSVSGSIEVVGEALSRLRLETVSGSIELAGSLAPRADLSLESHSGTIELSLPADVSGRFEVSTYSGRIRNDFGPAAEKTGRYTPESRLDFTRGGGDARVRVETFSGSVVLRRR